MSNSPQVRPSGASLLIVVLAIGTTAIMGYFAKRAQRVEHERLTPPPGYSKISLRMVDQGLGTPQVPTAPPSAAWIKLELLQDGTPVHFRPIQFRREARDADGRPVLVEHRWSEGFYYLCVRTGFPARTAPITINLTHRGQFISQFRVGEFQVPQRFTLRDSIRAERPQATLFRLKGPNVDPDEIGVRIDTRIAKGEVLVVQRMGTTFQNPEPYSLPELVQEGPDRPSRVMRLNLGYPAETTAVQLVLRRYRPRQIRRRINLPVRYAGLSDASRYYSTFGASMRLIPGIDIAFARNERAYRTERLVASPLSLTLQTRATLAWGNAKLVSPGWVYESRLRILNGLVRRSRLAEYPILQAEGRIEPDFQSEFDVTLDIDAGVYDLVSEETMVVPIAFKKINQWFVDPLTVPFHVRDEASR